MNKKLFAQQADVLLAVLNQQRHDWLNHFQVLLGYLKLGHPEKGEEYLRRVTEETQRESLIARLQCPPLSVYLLTYNALCTLLQLEVEVCNEVNLSSTKMESLEIYQLVIDYVDVIESHIEQLDGDFPNLLISFMAEDGHVTIKFDLAGRLSTSAKPEMEKLVEHSVAQGVKVLDYSHTDTEWMLALRFPTC